MDNKPRVDDEDVLPTLDLEKGQLRVSRGEDWVMMFGEAMRRVYEHEVTTLATGTFMVWYKAGKAVGKTEGEKSVGLINSLGIDEFAQELSKSYTQLGSGRIHIRDDNTMKNEITVILCKSPDGERRL